MTNATPTNLGDIVLAGSDRDRPAFIEHGMAEGAPGATGTVTLGELDAMANAVARGLAGRGFGRGDSIALAAENSIRYFAAYLGILRAGLVAVPLNYRQPPNVIAHVLADSETRLVLADAERRASLPESLPVIALDDLGDDTFAGLLDPGDFDIVDPGPDETAMLLYTSGSTGMPKGVDLSHRGQLYALSRWEGQRDALSRQRLLVAAPQYHMNALFLSKLTVYMNATAVLMPRFHAERYVRAIGEHGITWLTSVPTMLALAMREEAALAETDRSTVERISMGSAPLTEALNDTVQGWFPDAGISNFYGTTEHGPSAFGAHPDGLPKPKLALGYAAPGMELRLVGGPDENHGVLEVRSPSTMTGYRNLPGKTAEAVVDGWYHTKDVMTRDENGFYFIVGREDDMFVCNGENVYPGDVERMLETHPDVAQTSVVPVEDPVRGHAPVAFVVTAPGRSVEAEALQAYARDNGPAYQFPRHVVFIDALPLAGTNKVDRASLIREATDRFGASASG